MEYLGTRYAGFQTQPGKTTVQQVLEMAIANVTGEAVRVLGSGRTDAGAHAVGQVIAFSTESALPIAAFLRALNAHLPDDINVTSTEDVALSFHPRYDALRRTYRYLIWNRPVRSPFWLGRSAHVRPPLDVDRMDKAARHLIGDHDFGAFVAAAATPNRRRTMQRAHCWREADVVIVELEASGFMRQMVRAIAGTLIDVGLGKLDVLDFERILLSRDRARAGETAPACGLYLFRVSYPELAHRQVIVPVAPMAFPAIEFEEKL